MNLLPARPATDGTSLVEVTFAADPRLGRSASLDTDDGPLALRDDGAGGDAKAGDGIFTAAVATPYATLVDRQRAVLTELRRREIVATTIFDGPAVVGRAAIDFSALAAGTPARISFFDPPVPAFAAARTLTITDLGVVEDPTRTFNPCTSAGTPMGAWTFGALATAIVNPAVTGLDPSDVVMDWLQTWNTTPVINTFGVSARHGIDDVIAGWPKLPSGKLDLARAPLRLLAIVNRADLAGNPSYGHVGGAEGRFVFSVLHPDCKPRAFTVILEYGVPRRTCGALRDWAAAWIALDGMTPGTSAYNDALAALTAQFSAAGADPGKPAGSALSQLRTDENDLLPHDLDQREWELREFTLQDTAAGVRLRETTVKQTPDERFNGERGGARAPDLATWINGHQVAVTAGRHTVPLALPFPPGDGFLGGATLNFFTFFNGTNHRDYWTAPGIASNAARHQFSLATCNGCHGEETRTGFLHVRDLGFGIAPSLSGFLTGADVPDPVDPATTYHYAELASRAVRLAQLAGAQCRARVTKDGLGFGGAPLPPIGLRPRLSAH